MKNLVPETFYNLLCHGEKNENKSTLNDKQNTRKEAGKGPERTNGFIKINRGFHPFHPVVRTNIQGEKKKKGKSPGGQMIGPFSASTGHS